MLNTRHLTKLFKLVLSYCWKKEKKSLNSFKWEIISMTWEIYKSSKNCYVAFKMVQMGEDEVKFNILSRDMNKVGRIK